MTVGFVIAEFLKLVHFLGSQLFEHSRLGEEKKWNSQQRLRSVCTAGRGAKPQPFH